MKLRIWDALAWVWNNWNRFLPLITLATALVQELNLTTLSGAAKRERVVAALKQGFNDLDLGSINVIVELVVAILRWKGVLQ